MTDGRSVAVDAAAGAGAGTGAAAGAAMATSYSVARASRRLASDGATLTGLDWSPRRVSVQRSGAAVQRRSVSQ